MNRSLDIHICITLSSVGHFNGRKVRNRETAVGLLQWFTQFPCSASTNFLHALGSSCPTFTKRHDCQPSARYQCSLTGRHHDS